MYFKIGDNIIIGSKDSPYKLEPGISGLAQADIRTGDGLYAGVDGGYVSSQLYGMRTITFTGFYLPDSCAKADELRVRLLTELHIRYLYPIFIKTFAGNNYFTEGYLTDIKADINGPRANEFQLTFLCPDPIIYDGGDGVNSDSAWMEQTFYAPGAGGFEIKYTSPVLWEGGEPATVVNNIGTVNTYPIITLRGNYHNPTITNLTTGDFITISRNISSTDTVTIDMKQRIITLTDSGGNVTSIASDRTITSSWWYLIPGENKIQLTTTDVSDTDYGMIKYKQGFQGI